MTDICLPFKVRGRVPGSAVRISRDREVVVVEVELYGGDRYAVELDAAPALDLARALLAERLEEMLAEMRVALAGWVARWEPVQPVIDAARAIKAWYFNEDLDDPTGRANLFDLLAVLAAALDADSPLEGPKQ